MRKIPFAGVELTSQRVRGLRGTSELPGRPIAIKKKKKTIITVVVSKHCIIIRAAASKGKSVDSCFCCCYFSHSVMDGKLVGGEDPGKERPEQNWMGCLKDDFQAFEATDGSTVDNRLTFGVDRTVWTLAAKMDDGAPWHKGVL